MSKFLRKVMLIVNPASGCGKALDILPDVDRIFVDLGAGVDIRISENAAHATELARTAVAANYNRVIAMGGDGTVNLVASGIVGTGAILGVIPTGKGDDFFRMLQISKDLPTICRSALFGEPRLFDVGLLNNQPFFNMMGIGFDARVAMEVKSSAQNLGLASYLMAVYKTLKNYPMYNLRLRIDSLDIERTILLVAVGIGRSTGNGFYLTPQAVVDDGKFDVCLAVYTRPLRIMSLLPKALKGNHVRAPEITMYRCRQLEIFSMQPLPIHYEGETITSDNGKISIKISPDKLKVATGIKKNDE